MTQITVLTHDGVELGINFLWNAMIFPLRDIFKLLSIVTHQLFRVFYYLVEELQMLPIQYNDGLTCSVVKQFFHLNRGLSLIFFPLSLINRHH